MKSVYVATSLLNADRAKLVISMFKEHGVAISYDWTTHGQVFDESELQKIGTAEANGVKNADLLFMMHPARTGTHVELGIAIGCGKPVIIVFDQEQKQCCKLKQYLTAILRWFGISNRARVELKTFYFVPNVFRFTSLEKAFEFALEKLES